MLSFLYIVVLLFCSEIEKIEDLNDFNTYKSFVKMYEDYKKQHYKYFYAVLNYTNNVHFNEKERSPDIYDYIYFSIHRRANYYKEGGSKDKICKKALEKYNTNCKYKLPWVVSRSFSMEIEKTRKDLKDRGIIPDGGKKQTFTLNPEDIALLMEMLYAHHKQN